MSTPELLVTLHTGHRWVTLKTDPDNEQIAITLQDVDSSYAIGALLSRALAHELAEALEAWAVRP